MYGLLSLATEKIANKKWEDAVAELLFQPLGMSSTTFLHAANLSNIDIALAYLPSVNGSYRDVSLVLQR